MRALTALLTLFIATPALAQHITSGPNMAPNASNATLPAAPNALLGNSVAHTYFAKAYGSCTWDDTHDVSSCIQAAIAAAVADGGGKVIIPTGTFGLLNTITGATLVQIIGAGGAGAGRCATTLKWLGDGTVGNAGGTIYRAGASDATTLVFRSGLQDMCIDGNDLAANGVEEWSVISGYSTRIFLENTTAIGWLLDESNDPSDMNSHLNVYESIQISQGTAAAINATCFKIGQNSTNNSDASANKWYNFQCQYQNGVGIDHGAADSNAWYSVWIQPLGVGTTGKGIIFRGSNVAGTHPSFGNYMSDVAAGDGSHPNGGVWAETGSDSEASANVIAFIKTGDGENYPTDQTVNGTGVCYTLDTGYSNCARPRLRNPTTNITLTASDNGTSVSTNGSGSTQTANLPAALGGGIGYCFVQTDQQIAVKPATSPGTDVIRVGNVASGAGAIVQSQGTGSKMCLKTIKSGEWVAETVTGPWLVN